MNEEMEAVILTGIELDEGSIVTYRGNDAEGNNVIVAVDHRCAQDLSDVIFADGKVSADVPSWAFLSRWPS